MKVMSGNEMRKAERLAEEQGIPMSVLMERAGTKTAETALDLIQKIKLKNICVLCGSGNNGGDGFVTAGILSGKDCNVSVILSGDKPKTELAKMNFERLPSNVKVLSYGLRKSECEKIISESDMIIDAIYGIGFRGGLDKQTLEIVSLCNSNVNAYKIAVDLPSGIICDSGEIPNGCFNADITVSFTALKPLHILYPSMDFCGEVITADVGIPKNIIDRCNCVMSTSDEFVEENPIVPRKISAHKGTNGTLLMMCGSYGMAGAAVLSGGAALRTGVGLVKAAVPKSIYPIVSQALTEAVFVPIDQTDDGKMSFDGYEKVISHSIESCDAVLIGCGLGVNENTVRIVSNVIKNSTKPVVLDADGINSVCMNIDVLRDSAASVVLTPHPGEMARLAGTDILSVQRDRYGTAKKFAEEYGVTLVLKGANTLIATPEGNVYVNRTGNNGMAKGGSGDVLAGMLGSFLAQGMSPKKAAVYAVYYHGFAGDKCAEKYSKRAMLPSDIVEELKYIF